MSDIIDFYYLGVRVRQNVMRQGNTDDIVTDTLCNQGNAKMYFASYRVYYLKPFFNVIIVIVFIIIRYFTSIIYEA